MIVPMRPDHLDTVMRHEKAMFGTEAWSRASYRDELADTRHRYYLAAEDEAGELTGWGGVYIVGPEATITTVGVVPEHRRRGIARELLAGLLDEAKRRGAREVFLEVRVDNPAALALYASEGFATLGRRKGYYAHGRVDAAVMRREL